MSYSFQQQPPITPTSLPPPSCPPPPILPFSLPFCYPPSMVHLGSHHFSSNDNASSYPPLPPSSSPPLLLPSHPSSSPQPLLLLSPPSSPPPPPPSLSFSPHLPPPPPSLSFSPTPTLTPACARTTPKQLEILEDFFSDKKYVKWEDRQTLSREIGVGEREIKWWFQNRRAKLKKKYNMAVETGGVYTWNRRCDNGHQVCN